MASDGDPRRHTPSGPHPHAPGRPHPHAPGDPHAVLLHPHTPAPTNPHEIQARQMRRARKRAMKEGAKWEWRMKNPPPEAVGVELKQGPSEPQEEDPGKPQARQISPPGAPETPAEGHGHPESSAPGPTNSPKKKTKKAARWIHPQRVPTLVTHGGTHKFRHECPGHPHPNTPAPTNPDEEQARKEEAKRRRWLKKFPLEAVCLELEQGPSELQKKDPRTPPVRQPRRLYSSSARVTGSPAPAGARIRQSVLYSDRPSRSRRSARVGEHVREVSSREFEALTLDQSPPTPDSAQREDWRKLNEYKETMFDKDFTAQSATRAASCDKNSAVEHVTECSGAAKWAKRAAEWAKRAYLTQDEALQARLDVQRTMVAFSRDEPRCKVSNKDSFQNELFDEDLCQNELFDEDLCQSEISDEVIIQNGKKWMSQEVMVAFDEYIGRIDELKKLQYCFEKLHHQCFNVECYSKIFHHFNFSVKMKLPSSDDWNSKTYFAEVKEIFGEKFYFCCPLEKKEDGCCYACRNQGMDDLRHPATGGFERGLPDTTFPYM